MADDDVQQLGGAYENALIFIGELFNNNDDDDVQPALIPDEIPEEPEPPAETVERCVLNALRNGTNFLLEHPVKQKRRIDILGTVLGHWESIKIYEQQDAPKRIYYATKSIQEMDEVVDLLNDMEISNNTTTNLKVAVLRESSMRTRQVGEARPSRFYLSQNELHQRFPIGFQDVLRAVDAAALYGITNFGSKSQYDKADLIILPQHFIISPIHRKDYNINLEDAILIFDEGYDMEKLCCTEASVSLGPTELAQLARELEYMVNNPLLQNEDIELETMESMRQFSSFLSSLSQWVRGCPPVPAEAPTRDEILDTLRESEIEELAHGGLETALKTMLAIFTNIIPDIESTIHTLRKILRILTIFCDEDRSNLEAYNLYVARTLDNPTPTLKLFCIDPALIFLSFEYQTWSLILSSSCLAPISTFVNELGITFSEVVRIETHAAPNNRYVLAFCSEGPENVSLNLDYTSRTNPVVQDAVGNSVLEICNKMPNGVVVIVHTIHLLTPLVERWRNPQGGPDNPEPQIIMNQLQEVKNVFCELDIGEDQDPNDLFEEYRTASRSRKGALLLASARGKLHEKMSTLKGEEIRAIVHVSVPYAGWFTDDFAVAKRNRMYEENPEGNPREEFLEWYTKEAYRILDQSFAHCVQDEQDWGAVIVLDSRVIGKQDQFDELMPAWVRNKFIHHESIGGVTDRLQNLVQTCGGNVNHNN